VVHRGCPERGNGLSMRGHELAAPFVPSPYHGGTTSDIWGGDEVGHWCHRASRARLGIRLDSRFAFFARAIFQFSAFTTAPFIQKLTANTLVFFRDAKSRMQKADRILKRKDEHAQADHCPRDNSDTSSRLHRRHRESRGGDNNPCRKSATSNKKLYTR